MTQPTFKTAAELNITEAERDAFIQVMNHFRTPAAPPSLPPALHDGIFAGDVDHPPVDGIETRLGFAMNYQAHTVRSTEFECGAIACIGGHVSLLMQGVPVLTDENIRITRAQADVAYVAYAYVGDVDEEDARQRLFYPPEDEVRFGTWGRITPFTASFAIENFLTGAEPNWRDALECGGQSRLARPLDRSDDDDDL